MIYSLVALVLLINSGCKKEEYPYDKNSLTYKGKFVHSNQFEMNGLYYLQRTGNMHSIRYFFQNGSYFSSGTEEDILGINCYQIHSQARNTPYNWGYFIVEGGILKVQTFDPTSLQRYDEFKVEERWAKIENDTTLRFYKKITPEKKELDLNETFHFRYCSNKPDSLNVLMD